MMEKEAIKPMLDKRDSEVEEKPKLNGFSIQGQSQGHNGDISPSGVDVEELEERREDLQIDQDLVQCGFQCCAPRSIQRCAAIGPFTANASGLFFVNVAFFTYYLGVIRTLEKRFDLSSMQSSITISMMDVMFSLLSLIIGYIGRHAHKPRTMVVSQLLTSVGIFILAMPFAIYGAKPHDSQDYPLTKSFHDTHDLMDSVEVKRLMGLCVGDEGRDSMNSQCVDMAANSALTTEARNTYALLLSGSLLIGFGGVAVSNLGIPYIDENVKPNKSAFYVGLATSTYSWAPIIGLLLAAFCTRIPESLQDTDLRPTDPSYVGAWWLGMVVLGSLSFIVSLPMILFPKHLLYYHQNNSQNTLKADQEEEEVGDCACTGNTIEGPAGKERVENPAHKVENPGVRVENPAHKVENPGVRVENSRQNGKTGENPVDQNKAPTKQASTVTSHFKEFPRLMVKFFTNSAYMTLLLSKIFGLYGVTGIILQLPRYMEIHYRQPAYIASIIAALSGSIVGALGTVLGGYVMRRLKLSTLGIAKLFTMAAIFGTLGTAVCMAYGCPPTDLAGHWTQDNSFSVENACNRPCGCTEDVFNPVCAENLKTFISPCHAGCRQGSLKNRTYSDCRCLDTEMTLTQGHCKSDQCPTLVPYIITFILVSFLVSFGRVPATILMFRLVGEKDKAPVMGLTSFFVNILCFVPAPILFGYLFDSACLVWRTSCSKRGACLLYDTTRVRLLMHGVTLAFQLPSCIFAMATLYLIHRRTRGRRQEEEEEM